MPIYQNLGTLAILILKEGEMIGMNSKNLFHLHHRFDGHKFNTQDDILIRLGEHDTESIDEPHPHVDRKVKDIIIHPKYNSKTIFTTGYDLALIELDNPVDYSLNIIPICLPTDDNKLVGETGWSKGFGLTSPADFDFDGNLFYFYFLSSS